MTLRLLQGALALFLTVLPGIAAAQCMGGTAGGGHDHGSSAPSARETKADKAIRYLLSEEDNRPLLMDAILDDSAFMRDLIERIAVSPEWRALAAERIGATSAGPVPSPAPAPTEGTPPAPNPRAVRYVCPMHAEAVSDRPGKCPRCGMDLQRTP